MIKCRLIMDSGKEYLYDGEVEFLNKKFLTYKDGTLINGIVYMSDYAINPSHVSSIEYIEEEHDV